MSATTQTLQTSIKLDDGYEVTFNLCAGIDLSNPYFNKPPIVNVFGLPRETKEILYSTDNTSVNVDKLSICCHNNRTHTESTKHVYSNGLNISDIKLNTTFYGCIVITIKPKLISQINDIKEDSYECGVEINKDKDLMITKSMIKKKMNDIVKQYDNKLPSFFKQSIFIRVECDEDTKNKNCPFLSNNAMKYLHDNITNIFGINLCSVDRIKSPKIPNHKIWFGHNPKSHRLITEGLLISNDVSDGIYVLNFQLSPIANTDAVPTRPIIYKCDINVI